MAAVIEETASPPPPPAARKRGPLRKTSRAVRVVDKLSTAIITGGGLMVVVSVLGIMVYLTTVVIPLFEGARIGEPRSFPLVSEAETGDLLFVELNEYRTLGMAMRRSGRLVVFDAADGRVIEEREILPSEPAITAFARMLRGGHTAFGFADGTTRLANIEFTDDNVAAVIEEPVVAGAEGVPVVLLDYKVHANREVFTILTRDGELYWDEVTRRHNILTGKTTLRVNKHKLPFTPAETQPSYLLQNEQGDQVYIAWRDGTMRRYDLRTIEQPVVAEVVNVTPEPGVELTDLRFMFGDQSIIVSDSQGGVTAWFRVERREAGTADGYQLLPVHRMPAHPDRVTRTAMSNRDKGLLSVTADGEIWLRHMTSEQVLGKLRVEMSAPQNPAAVVALQITPKADGIFAVDGSGRAWLWDVSNPHPETTWKTIFRKVWYEGYNHPDFTWQSSSGNDDFEPKFSLVPLIFGTLKATFYSLLFAIPIALLGAIYTSQFLDKRIRAPIKSGIETMASLPSVVLGFIAALVLAPIVENWVVAVLAVFAITPVTVLLAGYLWQMMPQSWIVRYSGWHQFALLIALVLASLLLAREMGGFIERLLFHGDFKAWLNGTVGTGAPGILILVWPLCLLAVWLAQRKLIADRVSLRAAHLARWQIGLIELGKVLAILVATTFVAWGVATAMAGMGVDPRSTLVGTYVQRNTLVVGFVMGFAVIPIIYTISEDALSSVPEHLKSASLGCGATPWQTAIRVIVPVAMSGIFSAVMIGLGRAVGETMIVVMAAGNTPIMDVNIFNGLRALSANIAVELPEAVKDGTLYRMLFLAALTLFVMTFCINTLAEIIRMRFRQRAFQL
jgi:phosphate transport system permease protein